jgi:RNA polymerase sigma factor (sigma-70 family)
MTPRDLFRRHIDDAVGLGVMLLRRCPPWIDRDAALNAARIGLWQASERYPGEPGGFWLYARVRIRGAVRDELREQRGGRHRERPVFVCLDLLDLPDARPGPELPTEVSLALARLPAAPRALLVDHYLLGRDFVDIAAAIGVHKSRVSHRHAEALALLRGT